MSYVDFAPDDWLYSRLLSRQIEINDPVHCTMVGDSEAIHAQFLCPGNKLGNATHAVKEAILCMDVEVGEFTRHCSRIIAWHLQDCLWAA